MTENESSSPHVYNADLEPGSDLKSFFEHSTLVTQTGFFRETSLYEDLEKRVLPDLLRQKRRDSEKLLVWSAGCSDGREPYSIGMIIKKCLRDLNCSDLEDIQIRASDINRQQILQGIEGRYSIGEKERTRLEEYHDYYHWVNKGTIQVNSSLRRWIDFRVEDIMNGVVYREFDIIICALVLLYYKRDYRGVIIHSLLRSLDVGGYLYVEPAARQQMKELGLVRLTPHSHFYRRMRKGTGC